VKRASISSRLVVGAVLLVAALAAVDALRPDKAAGPRSDPGETVAVPEIQHAGGREEIERIGAGWARRFASNGLSGCYHTGQELCEQLHCVHVGGYKLPNCRLPTRSYRRTFRGAAVDDLVIRESEAAARLSNGEVIGLHADEGTWWVQALGGDAARGFFEKPG
jgi:hypothetical protein